MVFLVQFWGRYYINCGTDWWYRPLTNKSSFSKPRKGNNLSTVGLHQEKQMTVVYAISDIISWECHSGLSALVNNTHQ